MRENEYKERRRDVELFGLAYNEDGNAGELLIAKWHKHIYDILHGILKDKYIVDNLIGNVWGLLYGRPPADVKSDIMNKGLPRVFREIAKCVANRYLRDWDNGIGAIYGVSKNSRMPWDSCNVRILHDYDGDEDIPGNRR